MDKNTTGNDDGHDNTTKQPEIIDLVSSSSDNDNHNEDDDDSHDEEGDALPVHDVQKHTTFSSSTNSSSSSISSSIINSSSSAANENSNKKQCAAVVSSGSRPTSTSSFTSCNDIMEGSFTNETKRKLKRKRTRSPFSDEEDEYNNAIVTSSNINNNKNINNASTVIVTDIYRGDGDDGIVSSMIQHLQHTNMNNISNTRATYFRQQQSITSSTTIMARGELLHIQQKDQWSCGYRNLQMLLSAILPNVPTNHPIHGLLQIPQHNHDMNDMLLILIPSIKQLQSTMEQSWKQGFDEQGRQHFQNQIYNKKGHGAKIGAVEISSILSYLYVDTTVLQFIACYESRSLLTSFVWSYFHKLPSLGYGYHGSCFYCNGRHSSSSLDSSFEIIQYITNITSSNNTSCNSVSIDSASIGRNDDSNDINHFCNDCGHPLLPLYLQWEGHSVTCIGIEKVDNSQQQQQQQQIHSHYHQEYNLLIYDPQQSGTNIKQCLQQYQQERQQQNYHNHHQHQLQQQQQFQKQQYNDHKKKNALHLSTKELIQKDCQIVLCSLKPLSYDVRQTRAAVSHSNVITAAHDHVERVLLQR